MTKRKASPRRVVASTLACALIATPFGAAVAAPAAADTTITPIAVIQGTGSKTTLTESVTTRGVVTGVYRTGGYKGYVIQTPGTGGTPNSTGASDAIFVYMNANTDYPSIGQYVEVTGTPGEFNGLTQISNPTTTPLTEDVTAPLPLTMPWPSTDAAREQIESMLFMPTGDFTVSDTYTTGRYGEVVLAVGTTPLIQPTDVALPKSAQATAVEDDNKARKVTLDDGATTDFNGKNETAPYLSLTKPVTVGAGVTFTEPLIVDYRNNTWKLNPTSQILPGAETVEFKNIRTTAPDDENLGQADLTVASFNVLNYFTTGGIAVTCTSYDDREGNPITVNTCPGNGPRGAWDAPNLKRQQDKIVAAINATDASIVGLMEIENSAVLGEQADEATETLVAALNDAAGTEKWAYAPSSADLPDVSEQDVISNAIIYQKNEVKLLGSSRALGDQSGAGEAFDNAREPLGQAFLPIASDAAPLFVAVNHLKSKSTSKDATGGDIDSGDGQGAYNAARVAQATALVQWVPTALDQVKAETGTTVTDVALLGDFNSYSQEDPMQVLYDAGYSDAVKEADTNEYSYVYSSLAGSLDHVLYNSALADRVTGADIWNINSTEALSLEYSRYNSHSTLFYAPDAYRSSDHDPVIVGLLNKPKTVKLNVLDINDFHGRIDANTVKFAGTIEQQRKKYGEDNSLFISAGDNIGASLFASASAKDKPTIDVLNALDLATSVVGNHEFDQGLADLEGRVNDEAEFNYLGANVYVKGTTRPILDEYEIITVDGIKVGVIGAVTEETPTLVSPAGISEVDFGDPVEAVNRVAAKLTDGKAKNGEADVLIALYHEGASAGTPENATLETEVAAGGAFADIVTKTSEKVGAIFTGHTHKQYAWLANNGSLAKRPVIQTGNYGENIGQTVLTIDTATMTITNATAKNIARTTRSDAALIAAYPRVAEVNNIVTDALAAADIVGKQPVGSITADITSAFTDGGFTDGVFSGTKRDNRAEASSLGNLVADSLRETLSSAERGGADIGVVNPGGLRADLTFAPDGVVTYAEANAVLPFVNNLWTTNLTGAQVKTMLEQQWQTDADGKIPSRPYLQLGLSKNVTYTYDESRAHGDRITSITVNGKPIDAAATYTIGTFSFLATGGDNFRVFNDATGTKDSGLIDRDAWIAYLQANAQLAPNFARSGAEVSAFPSSVKAGETLKLDVKRLNTLSIGAPENTEITATFEGGTLTSPVTAGTATVTNGAATLEVTVPEAAAGAKSLVIVANKTKATATLPISVEAGTPVVKPSVALTAGTSVVGKDTVLTVKVTDPAGVATGSVEIFDGTKSIGKAPVANSTATIKVKLNPGKHTLTAVFTPTKGDKVTSAALTVTTVKAKSTISTKLTAATITYPAKGSVKVAINGQSVKPTGKIDIYNGSKKIASGTLKTGSATTSTVTITLPKLTAGKYKLEARYAGDSQATAVTAKIATLTVKKQSAKVTTSITNKGKTIVVKVSGKATPTGKVTVTVQGKKYTKTLKSGKATFKISKPKVGKTTYKVSYLGDKNTTAKTVKVKFTVKR